MTQFPPQPSPDDTTPDEFRKHVLEWLNAFNDWHLTVDTKLNILDERTRDLRWVKWGTIAGVAVGLLGVVVRSHSG